MTSMKQLLSVCALLALSAFVACGGGGSNNPPAPVVTVSLSPSTANLVTGATQQFTATVANTTNTTVTWSVTEGAAGGSVAAAGLYTAPATVGTYHVVATSVADKTKSATATVIVTAPIPISVSIAPTTANLLTGGTQQFTPTVAGSNSNHTLTWAVTEAGGGSVDNTGLYTAPAVPGIYHVVATSVADNSKSATATVTVTAPVVSVSLSPSTANVLTGATQQFSATVTNAANATVTWAVTEAGGGSVDNTGLYTAPAVPSIYHVVATSVADNSKSATATVTVTAPVVTVSLLPSTANVVTGATQQFTATVTNAANVTVTWAVTEAAGGSVDNTGLYTAPATAGTYHVVATSVADNSKSATATVTVSLPTATGLSYTDPVSSSYKLVMDPASSGSHLIFNLVGPATGTAMGVSLTLTGDAHTSWMDVSGGGNTVLLKNGTQFQLGSGTLILKGKVTGNELQVTVAQKFPTAPAALNGVLLQVALDLKAGQNLPQGTTLVLNADATKCQVLTDTASTPASIAVAVGVLKAQ